MTDDPTIHVGFDPGIDPALGDRDAKLIRERALRDASRAVCAGCSGSDATAYEKQPVMWQRMKLWMHVPPKGWVHPPRPCSASGIWHLLAKEGFLK